MLRHLILSAAVLATAFAALPAAGQSTTATGVSRAFNPAISVNSLLTARAADTSADRALNGADLQEVEVQFTSVVDPYWKANLIFAVHPEHGHAHEGEEDAEHGGYAGDLEVATIDGQAIPGGFGLVVGKDFLPFGKHAPLHTHQYPFVDPPAAVTTFLGDHGLTEVGVRLSRDLPLPWYSDLTGYAVDGRAEIFDAESRDPALGARWSNLFDLSTTSTLELGGSWLHGRQSHEYLMVHHEEGEEEEEPAGDLDVLGADLTWKWVSSSSSRGPALTVTGEVIAPRPNQGAGDPLGWYATAQYRFRQTWWLGLGTGWLDRDLPEHEEEEEEEEHHEFGVWQEVREYKANLTWVPSEFSAVRLEVAHYDDLHGDGDDTLVSLQFNFTIGSHPAHLY